MKVNVKEVEKVEATKTEMLSDARDFVAKNIQAKEYQMRRKNNEIS